MSSTYKGPLVVTNHRLRFKLQTQYNLDAGVIFLEVRHLVFWTIFIIFFVSLNIWLAQAVLDRKAYDNCFNYDKTWHVHYTVRLCMPAIIVERNAITVLTGNMCSLLDRLDLAIDSTCPVSMNR